MKWLGNGGAVAAVLYVPEPGTVSLAETLRLTEGLEAGLDTSNAFCVSDYIVHQLQLCCRVQRVTGD